MKNSSSKISWVLFALLAISLVGTNIYLWTAFIAIKKENQNVRSDRDSLFSQVEEHEQKRQELDELYTKQTRLLKDLNQLVFLSENVDFKVPNDLIPKSDRAFVFSRCLGNDIAETRIFLPPDIRATVFFHEIVEDPQKKKIADQFEPVEVSSVSITGAGWHSIDRALEQEGESQRLVFKVDGRVEQSLSIEQKRTGSKVSSSLPKILMIDQIDPKSGKANFPTYDKWTLVFGIPNQGRVGYGFSIDSFMIEKDAGE